MTDNERRLASRWFEEVWNRQRREAIAEMLSPDAVLHEGADQLRGPEGFYPFYDRIRATFPDLYLTIEQTVAEDDLVCVRWSCTMTHTGDGLGMPPTGKKCSVTGMSILRVVGGKLVEGWQNWDMLGLLQQIQGAPQAATYVAAP
jgi:steroid delta-isomerase-like uncharacterized protein